MPEQGDGWPTLGDVYGLLMDLRADVRAYQAQGEQAKQAAIEAKEDASSARQHSESTRERQWKLIIWVAVLSSGGTGIVTSVAQRMMGG